MILPPSKMWHSLADDTKPAVRVTYIDKEGVERTYESVVNTMTGNRLTSVKPGCWLGWVDDTIVDVRRTVDYIHKHYTVRENYAWKP
jgi:hypothetical protein